MSWYSVRRGCVSLALLAAFGLLIVPSHLRAGYPVTAVVETDPVSHVGDAADDPCVWIHPTDTSRSTVIGTDKLGGINVYNLDGSSIQYVADGRINNVDIRYGFLLAGERVDLVAASNRTDDNIAVYRVDTETRQLVDISARRLDVGLVIYGFCLYRHPGSGTYYAFVNAQDGRVEQWHLFDNGSGLVDAALVRSFDVGSMVEGCVADDDLAHFYIGEENVGIWKYGAKPEDGSARTLVAGVGANLVADVEGLTLYYASKQTGYLIASSQGNSTYAVYQREGSNAFVTSFEIAAGSTIDGVTNTDGIDVTNVNLGPPFAGGMFVAQDNSNPGANQNFKLVPWESIADGANPRLVISSKRDPRSASSTRDSVSGLKSRFR